AVGDGHPLRTAANIHGRVSEMNSGDVADPDILSSVDLDEIPRVLFVGVIFRFLFTDLRGHRRIELRITSDVLDADISYAKRRVERVNFATAPTTFDRTDDRCIDGDPIVADLANDAFVVDIERLPLDRAAFGPRCDPI